MGTHSLTIRSAGLLALTTAAVTLTGTEGAAATAGPPGGGLSVTPASPAAGTDIALLITGCGEHTATAASDAFVADTLLAGADGTLAGESRVRSSARPGTYDVQVMCGAEAMRFKGALTVAAPAVFPASAVSTSPSTSPSTTPSAAASPSASAAPASPVRAGGGGTADLVAVDGVAAVDEADGSPASGSGTARSLTGFALAGAAAVAVALRCSRRRRQAD
ncbi:hypothetical protein [Streptomyces sp. NPDC047000]|uniref:hypothetical protein n=1 Tax=Streptomyces sp. NPDC047000 TaxID=3155474 RepID=UPI0033F12AFE